MSDFIVTTIFFILAVLADIARDKAKANEKTYSDSSCDLLLCEREACNQAMDEAAK